MSQAREIRCYDYVNHPYGLVRDALITHGAQIFEEATRVAADRAGEVAAELRVEIAGLEIGAEIALDIKDIEEVPRGIGSDRLTRMRIDWKSARAPRLFPVMQGELSVYPLTGRETQLDFFGRYDPPMGIVGDAIDAMLGHRFAEVSVHGLVQDLARYLREKLAR